MGLLDGAEFDNPAYGEWLHMQERYHAYRRAVGQYRMLARSWSKERNACQNDLLYKAEMNERSAETAFVNLRERFHAMVRREKLWADLLDNLPDE